MGVIYKCDKCGKECTNHYMDIFINEICENEDEGRIWTGTSSALDSLILCPHCFGEVNPNKIIIMSNKNPHDENDILLGTWEPKEEEE